MSTYIACFICRNLKKYWATKTFPGRDVPLNSWKACYIRPHFECIVNRDEASSIRDGEVAKHLGEQGGIQSL